MTTFKDMPRGYKGLVEIEKVNDTYFKIGTQTYYWFHRNKTEITNITAPAIVPTVGDSYEHKSDCGLIAEVLHADSEFVYVKTNKKVQDGDSRTNRLTYHITQFNNHWERKIPIEVWRDQTGPKI